MYVAIKIASEHTPKKGDLFMLKKLFLIASIIVVAGQNAAAEDIANLKLTSRDQSASVEGREWITWKPSECLAGYDSVAFELTTPPHAGAELTRIVVVQQNQAGEPVRARVELSQQVFSQGGPYEVGSMEIESGNCIQNIIVEGQSLGVRAAGIKIIGESSFEAIGVVGLPRWKKYLKGHRPAPMVVAAGQNCVGGKRIKALKLLGQSGRPLVTSVSVLFGNGATKTFSQTDISDANPAWLNIGGEPSKALEFKAPNGRCIKQINLDGAHHWKNGFATVQVLAK